MLQVGLALEDQLRDENILILIPTSVSFVLLGQREITLSSKSNTS